MKLYFLLGFTLLTLHANADSTFPGIKTLMTTEEASLTGINDLTEQQISALNQWLIRYTANEADLIQKTREVKEESFKPITGKIAGKFRGWNGKTKFKLENGQIWQQRYNNKWTTNLDSPEISITRNTLGFFDMKVLASDRIIGVKRIK
ncbi:MAG: hypothetical protein ACRBBW_09390 [Cellvibrionaceae bacterium]